MGIGIFTDKGHQPTVEAMLATVGSKRLFWEKLTGFISDNHRAQRDFTFYGKNYGWAVRFRKGGKALISLYPGKEEFTVQIVLGPTQADEAFGLNLGENVIKIIENAHKYPEGRWLFIKIESEQDLGDVQKLLMVKSPPGQLK